MTIDWLIYFNIGSKQLSIKILCIFFILLFYGCSGIQYKVQKHISKNNFDEALLLLEKEGAGLIISPDASEEAVKARVYYDNFVSKNILTEAKALLDQGNIDGALLVANKGISYCPWSTESTTTPKRGGMTVTLKGSI